MAAFSDLMFILGGSAGILLLLIMATAPFLPHQRRSRDASSVSSPAASPAAGLVPAQRRPSSTEETSTPATY
ncbi:hypothetical protein ACVGVM_19815 [Pseudonocardia bannensis]|uniref:Uncharacterized protein n=1 Tax=Pseudonocardia bannensis TaxID=630973 RepID=A0A848DP92_9PSEU|nr:hypothetical protein [Pseudonocardia bannensis]NMH94660.1 hypothetical protein [Pseudonocardia bannensis]